MKLLCSEYIHLFYKVADLILLLLEGQLPMLMRQNYHWEDSSTFVVQFFKVRKISSNGKDIPIGVISQEMALI